MITYLDRLLDRITMYRVMLYYLIAILAVAVLAAGFGSLPYSPAEILGSVAFLLATCLIGNWLFSQTFEAPANPESSYITALILASILPPLHSVHDLPLLFWAGALAIGSKYILAIRGKHLFNPAAVAVVLTSFWLSQSATWWVGTPALLPVVLIGGIAMVRKMRRYGQVFAFIISTLATSALLTALAGHDIVTSLNHAVLSSSLFFFAFVMLTEPLTSPPTALLQGIFGVAVGILFAPQAHIGSFFFTPELALVTGNVFSYFVSPKVRERLKLRNSTLVADGVLELEMEPGRSFRYLPGQYMEFTLPHHNDARGARRYFTLSSSPTENNLKLGIKFYPKPSTFKQALQELAPGQSLMAGQIAGDFVMPRDTTKKLAFLAGGIGVTPFRSMLKYVADTDEKRSITMVYMNKTAAEIAYTELFNQLQERPGIRIVHTLTDQVPEGWVGRSGRIDEAMVRAEIPDFMERTFYLSGPHPMVSGMESLLRGIGLPAGQIKTDFFPGLA